MSCDFIWYNLPQTIKNKIITPLESILSAEVFKTVKTINWHNAPRTLDKLFDILVSEYLICTGENYIIQKSNFIWFNLPKKIEVVCTLVEALQNCETEPIPQFRLFSISPQQDCVGNLDEITLIGEGFLEATDVVFEGYDTVSFEIVSDTIITARPLFLIEELIKSEVVQVTVVKGTETTEQKQLTISEITTPGILYPIVGENGELNESIICLENGAYAFTNNNGAGRFKSSDTSIIEENFTGTFTPKKKGVSYLFYDLTFETSGNVCDRAIMKVTVIASPSITQQPIGIVRLEGSTVEFAITANDSLGYAWEVSEDFGGTYAPLVNDATYSGVATNTLTITNIQMAQEDFSYRCELIGESPCGNVYSNDANLNVNQEIGILSSSPDVAICNGGAFTASVETEGTVVSYQWYVNNLLTIEAVVNDARHSGANTSVLTVINNSLTNNGYAYYLEVSGATEIANSAPINISVTTC